MTSGPFLSYGRHVIEDDDVAAVVRVLQGQLVTQGDEVPAFEEEIAERVGARHAIAVSSGTAALHLACLAADVAPGVTGLTTPLTFVATANAVRYCGGEVVLADIEGTDLGLDVDRVADALVADPSIRVLLPVHFAGLAHASAELRRLAGDRTIIEDASHALGGRYAEGDPIGSCRHCDMTVFSLHPVKSITTGEGGLVTTNDDELARRVRLLRNHGNERDPERFVDDQGFDADGPLPWYYELQELGFNYRLTDIQAALGRSQLKKLERFVSRRRAIAEHYDAELADVPGITPLQAGQRGRSGNHLYVVSIDGAGAPERRAFLGRLAEHGVGGQVHYVPVHRQPYYQKRYGWTPGSFPVADAVSGSCLSLPLHPALGDADVARVVEAVREAVA